MGDVPLDLISISGEASAMHAFKNIDSKEGCKVVGDSEEKEVALLQIVFVAIDYLLGQ